MGHRIAVLERVLEDGSVDAVGIEEQAIQRDDVLDVAFRAVSSAVTDDDPGMAIERRAWFAIDLDVFVGIGTRVIGTNLVHGYRRAGGGAIVTVEFDDQEKFVDRHLAVSV